MLVAVATAPVPVGVDVERRVPFERLADLRWALSEDERCEVTDLHWARLTEIWTAKEAAGKAAGTGLGGHPASVRTQPGTRADTRTATITTSNGDLCFEIAGMWCGDHHLSVATPGARNGSI
ncbi:4'-phosphopantetheinyl transferase superfamily protein [Leifsonia aquatica]|uniref:4'-phosphopantetheinyl transferase superfamily protein n=1 Tax=Leifsonia aquatica TaxID=144185 RepID=UPI00384EA0E3